MNEQAKNIIRLLNDLIKRDNDQETLSVLMAFSSLVKRRLPVITCGLFDFDWKLIYSTFASAVTNFIILVQFDWASRKKVA